MRILSFLKFYMLSVALLFMLYAASDLGIKREALLFLAFTILSPTLFRLALQVRGVRAGDTVLVTLKRQDRFGYSVQKLPARALTSGRIGEVIDVEFGTSAAKGEIASYGGILFPAEVNLLYYEERRVVNPIA